MYNRTKKDIIRDIKKAPAVYVPVHGLTEHDMYYVKTTRVAILDVVSEVEDNIKFNYIIDKFGDVIIG